eukprot:GHVT01065397.1.p1 GENE.GHVT01065397.1~~GHVT01065397.1.p1  ORF type:complete len:393 (-),score=54.92 GHVT01065397.1:304-1482(-)
MMPADGKSRLPTPCLAHQTAEEVDVVYAPAGDTFLLIDALASDFDNIKNVLQPTLALEIGPGSGVVSTFLLRLYACGRRDAALSRPSSSEVSSGSAVKLPAVDVSVKSLCSPSVSAMSPSSFALAGRHPVAASSKDGFGEADARMTPLHCWCMCEVGDASMDSSGWTGSCASSVEPVAHPHPPFVVASDLNPVAAALTVKTARHNLLVQMLDATVGNLSKHLRNTRQLPHSITQQRDCQMHAPSAAASSSLSVSALSSSTSSPASSSTSSSCFGVPNVSDGSSVPCGLFDLILFNPPYVPTPRSEVAAGGITSSWAGGESGREVIDAFLELLPSMLAPRGWVYLLLEDQNKPQEVVQLVEARGMDACEILKRRSMNEFLYVYRLSYICPSND